MWTLRPEAWQGPRPPECMPNTTCDKLYLLAHVRDPPKDCMDSIATDVPVLDGS